jgi:hypothetical protein
MRARNMALIPTMTLFEVEAKKSGESAEDLTLAIKTITSEVRVYSQAGGQILFGTDVGYIANRIRPRARYDSRWTGDLGKRSIASRRQADHKPAKEALRAIGELKALNRASRPVRGPCRIAVNLRLTEPEAVARIPIDHFDGLERFEDLPRDGRCVVDYWF